MRRIVTDDDGEHGKAYFIPVCVTCGKFVKVYEEIVFDYEGQPFGKNADCKKCGPTEMIFEGYL